MRRGLTCYDEDIDPLSTTEDDSCLSSELDLLNPRVTSHRMPRACRASSDKKYGKKYELPSLPESTSGDRDRFRSGGNCTRDRAKLLSEKSGKIATIQKTSSLQGLRTCDLSKKYEHQVTFVEDNRSSGGEEFYADKSRKGSSTPRIVRAIRKHSKKIDQDVEDRSISPQQPARPDNSKSSVVVLYHDKSSAQQAIASPRPALRSSRSDQTVTPTRIESGEKAVTKHLPSRGKPAESPEVLSPRFPIHRRRNVSRKHRRSPRHRVPLNVNIYHESRVVRVVSPPIERWTPDFEGAGSRLTGERLKFEVQQQEVRRGSGEKICSRQKEGAGPEGTKAPCRSFDPTGYKRITHRSEGTGVPEQNPQSSIYQQRNFAFLMQQMQTQPREAGDERVFTNAGDNNDNVKRVFPFQTTPSGNLKIIPNQVVFESKKVSVLVADPKQAKVNVEADVVRPVSDAGRTPSEYSAQPALHFADLPPGVTPSAINQLQIQKKLSGTGPEYKPRTQPYKSKLREEMEKKQSLQMTSHTVSPVNEVPLSTLGFTGEQPIDWDNVILPEKTDLYQELARRITNYKNADCIVRIGQDEFHCHLLVLQSYSSFFDEKNSKDVELSESSVTSKAFSIIYDWMISTTGESCHLLRRDNILEIFTAAQYLGMKELEEQCWAFIDNDELFCEDTAFLLYLDAKKIGNTAVMELMIPRIMKFFLMLVSTKDFLELSVDELCLLLRSNYISVNSEMEVLMSAVRWLMYDWETRKEHMLEVLKCVRFGLIAPWQLVDVKRNPENPEFMELMSYPEIQKMVDDGLAFVIIKYWYGKQTEDYYHWIDLLGLTEPANRNWAGEDKNYVTYREFLLYLEEYQKTKIADLKCRSTKTKPTPPTSPPKESPSVLPSRQRNAYLSGPCSMDMPARDCPQLSRPSRNTKSHSKMSPNYFSPDDSPGMMMPPEMLSVYLNNVDRSGIKVNNHIHGEQSNPPSAVHETRPNRPRLDNVGDGEPLRNPYSPGKGNPKYSYEPWQQLEITESAKLDYEGRRGQNAANACRHQQWEPNLMFLTKKQSQQRYKKPSHPDERTDSPKSEEEAATMIQAIYRGYKARRRFHEIRKSSSDERHNARRVAELLSLPIGQNVPKPLEPVKISISSASQGRSEKDRQQSQSPRMKKRSDSPTLRNCQKQQGEKGTFAPSKDLDDLRFDSFKPHGTKQQRLPNNDVGSVAKSSNPIDSGKPIKTIKPPAFFHNCDQISSMSPSLNSNADDLFPQRREVTFIDGKNVDRQENWNEANSVPEDNDEIRKSGDVQFDQRETQIRDNKCASVLPQRISSSILAQHSNNYVHGDSLFLLDRESILVFGGIDPMKFYGSGGATGCEIYRYKPDENVWESVGEIPQPRHHHAVAYLRGRIYLAGGADAGDHYPWRRSTSVATVWSFDPTTRTWRDEPNMLTPRKYFSLVVSHGKMYAMGGEDDCGIALKSVEAFDPVKSVWQEMQPMHIARVGLASTKYRDLIWVAGGMTTSKEDVTTRNVECFNPTRNLWVTAGPLRVPRSFFSLYVVSDCLYAIGGASRDEKCKDYVDSIDVWDPKLGLWVERATMSSARQNHCVGSIGNQMLIFGGVATMSNRTLNIVERYCCERGKWINGVSALRHAISGHCTVSLPPANLLTNS